MPQIWIGGPDTMSIVDKLAYLFMGIFITLLLSIFGTLLSGFVIGFILGIQSNIWGHFFLWCAFIGYWMHSGICDIEQMLKNSKELK